MKCNYPNHGTESQNVRSLLMSLTEGGSMSVKGALSFGSMWDDAGLKKTRSHRSRFIISIYIYMYMYIITMNYHY